MRLILNGLTTIAQRLYPIRRFVFYLSFVFFFVLLYQVLFLDNLQSTESILYLLYFLWGLLLYVFINAFGFKDEKNIKNKSFLYTLSQKIKVLFFYFFIMVFIVLFFLSMFYTYKILNV